MGLRIGVVKRARVSASYLSAAPSNPAVGDVDILLSRRELRVKLTVVTAAFADWPVPQAKEL